MRRETTVRWFCLALLLAGWPAVPAPKRAEEREALKRALADVVERGQLRGARVGVEVRSLEDGVVVFSHNGEDLLNPASNVKLFTAAAALFRLGPEYRFDTEFLAEPGQGPGKVKNLYVRGKGDPSVTTERLYGMVSELLHEGLHEVEGDLVIDDSWFDAEREAPGFDQEDTDRSYMAPTGAVSLNWNTVGVYLRAGPTPGSKATVEVEPPSDFFVVENALVTGSSRARRFSVSSEPFGDSQKLQVRGVVPFTRESWSTWKKIDNPPMYFGQTLKRLLFERGVLVKGKVKLGAVPPTAKLFWVAQSETLDLVLKRLNKNSSNFVAEQLVKTLGAEMQGPPGSFAKGISAIEDFLERQARISRGSYVMKNGSGLNDTNRFSAAQTARLLQAMWNRFPLAPEYLSSMGIAAKDGTLKYRFEGSEAAGRLRAKTGTLENVSALSGYVQAVGGETFAFSVLVNDYAGRAGPVLRGVDAVGIALAASGSAEGPSRAIAQALATDVLLGNPEEVKARVKTYLALSKQADKRNVTFLRTAWRNEKDPAVRAAVSEAIYRSNPQDYVGQRALLDSFLVTPEVFGRLSKVAGQLAVEVPGMSSVFDLAAEGNLDALTRVVELCEAAAGNLSQENEVAKNLAEVARTAPDELLYALQKATAAERRWTTELLARGLVEAKDPEHPFWNGLKAAMGSVDPVHAALARELETALSQRVAQLKAPAEGVVSHEAPAAPAAKPSTEVRPGG